MTRYSLNQIEHTVRKATRGAGLSWGVAEDAGRAVRWLHMIDAPGVSLAAATLEEIDHADALARKVKQRAHGLADSKSQPLTAVLSSESDILSPLVVGPCIGDWANSIDTNHVTHVELAVDDVVYPQLLAGYCGVAAQQTSLLLLLKWEGFQMLCTENCVHISNLAEDCAFESEVIVVAKKAGSMAIPDDDCVRELHIGSAEVDLQAWELLEKLTQNTYVEASEDSRLSGAGAGLNDND